MELTALRTHGAGLQDCMYHTPVICRPDLNYTAITDAWPSLYSWHEIGMSLQLRFIYVEKSSQMQIVWLFHDTPALASISS